ncbi:cytochrome-c peroxidase [Novosphingobium sp. AP12]|uniref:cytochrome-c peroxidase n=1 Tax=Novosphingobium sp. AP12 TaxID=1144305 RepID=UPI0005652121|nr:cytochrome c peroxidase [Novosphingobium sp. AP12]
MTALVLSVGAATPWEWDLPPGVAPPPVPASNAMTAARVELGRRLFYDADLSANGTMACAACHEQRRAFADGNATRPGVHGDPGRRNVPGLANVAWFSRLTYADPRITTLEAQVLVPLIGERPVEMGMQGLEAELPRRLGADPCYRRMFRKAFPERQGAIGTASVTAALAAFERTMVSFRSRFDQGPAAMTPVELQGQATFQKAGCASCHSGDLLTDMAYHRLSEPDDRDPGLAESTGRRDDAGRFRTPSLRNVAVTGPWWHDGSAKTLEEAVRRHPAPLAEETIPAVTAYLGTLTDPDFLGDRRLSRPDEACGKRL